MQIGLTERENKQINILHVSKILKANDVLSSPLTVNEWFIL